MALGWQRALAPSLGERMLWETVHGKEVFVRELLPQDLKFEPESLTEEEARLTGWYLASFVGIAHARQLEPEGAKEWLSAFKSGDAEHLLAPAWLWASVVELVAPHERACLEHCREYAVNLVEK